MCFVFVCEAERSADMESDSDLDFEIVRVCLERVLVREYVRSGLCDDETVRSAEMV